MKRLQQWRDRLEKNIDSRPRMQPLTYLSHYLTEFQYSKVDEIEVPGQYTEDKDSNQAFTRIQKFVPKFETCRSNGQYWKRFTLVGNDHSRTSFLVQLPCHRQWRREERVIQVLRTLNTFVKALCYPASQCTNHDAGRSIERRKPGGAILPSICQQSFRAAQPLGCIRLTPHTSPSGTSSTTIAKMQDLPKRNLYSTLERKSSRFSAVSIMCPLVRFVSHLEDNLCLAHPFYS